MKPWAQRMWWRTTWLCRLHRRRGWDGQTVAVDLFRGLLWSFDWKLLWTYCNICNVDLEFPIVPKTHSYKHGPFLRALQVGSWQMPCLLLEEMSPILRSKAILIHWQSDWQILRGFYNSIRRRYHRYQMISRVFNHILSFILASHQPWNFHENHCTLWFFEVPEIYGQMWFPRTPCCWRVASSSSGRRPLHPLDPPMTCPWRAARCWSRPVRVNTCTVWPVAYWTSGKVAGWKWKRWAEIQLALEFGWFGFLQIRQLMSQMLWVHTQPRCFFVAISAVAGESMGEDGSSSHPGNWAEQQADFGQGEMGRHAPPRAGWSNRCSQNLWGQAKLGKPRRSVEWVDNSSDMLFKFKLKADLQIKY